MVYPIHDNSGDGIFTMSQNIFSEELGRWTTPEEMSALSEPTEWECVRWMAIYSWKLTTEQVARAADIRIAELEAKVEALKAMLYLTWNEYEAIIVSPYDDYDAWIAEVRRRVEADRGDKP